MAYIIVNVYGVLGPFADSVARNAKVLFEERYAEQGYRVELMNPYDGTPLEAGVQVAVLVTPEKLTDVKAVRSNHGTKSCVASYMEITLNHNINTSTTMVQFF